MAEAAERTALDAGPLAEAVASLPWLAPSCASLAAWCRAPSLPSWLTSLRYDPAVVLLLLRAAPLDGERFPGASVEALAPLEFASKLLGTQPRGWLDWADVPCAPIYKMSRALAVTCGALVTRAGRGNPDQAWAAGLLAPLGWMAALALAPRRVSACLSDPTHTRDPAAAQRHHLGIEAVALTRRLSRAWHLPEWLGGVIGRLDLPLDHAARLGSDPVLFAAVRLALDAARRAGIDAGLLPPGVSLDAEERLLGPAGDLPRVDDLGLTWDDPYKQPLLLDLLAVALERGRLRRAPLVARLERETEALHRALGEQVATEETRLRESKLCALGEFAAGAGHEINNPLAVISGQAQYLLRHPEWMTDEGHGAARQSLESVIAQTKRVHVLLRELMLFARPASPRPAWFELPALLGEVASAAGDLSRQKQTRVEIVAPERFAAFADADQVRQALCCLLRNAVEAGAGGWARLTLNVGTCVEVWVEDSGPGPADDQRPHLFDPFYSGRSAGRGKGLGLPVAWRLARLQGGDVRLDARRDGRATRFVLALPTAEARQKAA